MVWRSLSHWAVRASVDLVHRCPWQKPDRSSAFHFGLLQNGCHGFLGFSCFVPCFFPKMLFSVFIYFIHGCVCSSILNAFICLWGGFYSLIFMCFHVCGVFLCDFHVLSNVSGMFL